VIADENLIFESLDFHSPLGLVVAVTVLVVVYKAGVLFLESFAAFVVVMHEFLNEFQSADLCLLEHAADVDRQVSPEFLVELVCVSEGDHFVLVCTSLGDDLAIFSFGLGLLPGFPVLTLYVEVHSRLGMLHLL